MSADVLMRVNDGVRVSRFGFAIQLDESTGMSNCLQLLVYVRCAGTNSLKTELLISTELLAITKGKDVFRMVDDYFQQNLDWNMVVGCNH